MQISAKYIFVSHRKQTMVKSLTKESESGYNYRMNRIEDNSWIIKRPIAHRGLHDEFLPENSKAAYENAIKNGYPIEMDIQLTKDGELVCFHDDNMKRMTGVDAFVYDKTLSEIREMRLAGTDEGIMTFGEFLKLVGGKVPLMIEIKTTARYKEVAEKTVRALDGYTGEFAVQSFDPRIIKVVRQSAPEIIRGQLICRKRHKGVAYYKDFLLRHGLLNFLSKPDFINMNVECLPVPKRIKRGRRVISWTIRTESDKEKAYKYAENVIFEKMRI